MRFNPKWILVGTKNQNQTQRINKKKEDLPLLIIKKENFPWKIPKNEL